MSDLGIIQESGSSPEGLEMFNRGCSKWIMPEKSNLWGATQLGAKEKVSSLMAKVDPVC